MSKDKKLLGVGAVLGAVGAWNVYRNYKYPLDKEYRLLNKFFFPPCMVNQKVIVFGNKILRKMKPYPIPKGISREIKFIQSENNATIKLTIYKPETLIENMPCLLYCHGGGFFFEDSSYIHDIVAHYAKEAQCQVVFVHYRTSDVAPFPTPFLDCCHSLQYVWNHSEELGIDRTRIAVGGDSAGGALAAACALWARDESDIKLCFQLLVYPAIDCRMETETMKKYVDGPTWNARLNKEMWKMYLRKTDYTQKYADKLQYASPSFAESFENLPPAYIEVQQFDSLHDEGVWYAQVLEEAGITVQLEDVKGSVHGFDTIPTTKAKQMRAIREKVLRDIFWGR